MESSLRSQPPIFEQITSPVCISMCIGLKRCNPRQASRTKLVSRAMAFVTAAVGSSRVLARSAVCGQAVRVASSAATLYGASPRMAVVPEGEVEKEGAVNDAMYDSGVEIDTDAIKEKALEVVSDVSTRPLFYGKIVAYVVGGLVSFTVLKAVVSAIDSIPVLPAGLELIGLGYTGWFVWRYVLFKESREELLEEIEDFLGRANPSTDE